MSDWLKELPAWARDLLAEARVARLGLLDDAGQPRVLPITFAIHGGAVWTAIDRKPKRSDRLPARVRFVQRRPEVAVTVDRYSDDWGGLAWVQLLGRTRVIDAHREPEVIAALGDRYEQYRGEPPPGPLIAIEVGRTLCWRAAGG